MRMTPDAEESIRCTVSTCSCASFKPGGVQLRSCDQCGHGWVAHALEKFQAQPPSNCGPVEVALPGLVFDLSSLVLYGAEAVPVRLKILLDRLYSVLTPEQVGHILHTLGWSLSDYVRGYKLQQSSGKVLDQWLMVTPEEEFLILKQFLRFGETRPIVELMIQCMSPDHPKTCHSNVCTFSEQSTGTPGAFRNTRGDSRLLADGCHFETPADRKGTVHPFESFPGGPSLLLPFHYSGSTFHCMLHPTKNLPPSTKVTQCQPKLSGTKPTEGRKQDGGHGVQKANNELAYKIKPDPDKPYLDRSLWHQNHSIQKDLKVLEVQRALPKHETTSPFPPMKSTLNHSSSFYPSISSSSPSSSSPLKPTQKWQSSSSSSIHSLPPISSAFLCPLPSLSSSSSLLPMPSSLCSLSSSTPAGSRKGRVCCGVCGKSFYDKGTLKIHYNAVHLKIKHRCTVAGCTMVFSSLRSRNRHSANPNPRLHTSTSRDSYSYRNSHSESYTVMQTHRDSHVHKHTHDTPSKMSNDIQDEQDSYSRHWQQNGDNVQQNMQHINTVGHGLNTQMILKHRHQRDTPPHADSPPASLHSIPQSPTTDTYNNASFRSNQQPPPLPPPPFLPADTTSPLGSPASFTSPVEVPPKQSPHLLSLHPYQSSPKSLPGHSPNSTEISSNQEICDNDTSKGNVSEARATSLNSQKNQWESSDILPKKKPRKSSMPVKIEREKVDGRENEEEELF